MLCFCVKCCEHKSLLHHKTSFLLIISKVHIKMHFVPDIQLTEIPKKNCSKNMEMGQKKSKYFFFLIKCFCSNEENLFLKLQMYDIFYLFIQMTSGEKPNLETEKAE